MLVKKPKRNTLIAQGLTLLKKKRTLYILGFIFLIGYSAFCFVLGGVARTKGDFRYYYEAIKHKPNIPLNFIKGQFSNPDKLSINIKFLDLKKIEHKREVALKTGVLLTSSDDFVPATINFKGKNHKVKLRLKGDWTDHLIGKQWSFRVKVSGDNTIMGMKKFSLQRPHTRKYINEWIFQKLLKKEGVLALRYKFLTLSLNGDNLGIYAIEEHFEKRLLENQQMKEGPIIKISESLMWARRAQHGYEQLEADSDLTQNEPTAFQMNKILKNPSLKKQFLKGASLINAYNNEKLNTSDVFDIDSLATFLAITDLTGANHALAWHNMRFYYNPITSKLMPIGFDGSPGLITTKLAINNDELNLFRDNTLIKKYVEVLERISQKQYLESFFTNNKNLQKNLNILYKDFPALALQKDTFYKNQRLIKTAISPINPLVIYTKSKGTKHLTLQIGNNQQFPIEILGINSNKKRIIIPRKKLNEFMSFQEYSFRIKKKNLKKENLYLSYRLLGHSEIKKIEILPHPRDTYSFQKSHLIRKPENTNQFSFLIKDIKKKEIRFKSGDWVLDKPLILPKGYTIKAFPGLTLTLSNNAMIFSQSPLHFKGSSSNPIIIKTNRTSGQGIAIINAKHKSALKHVHFQGLSSPSYQDWALSGAVTFYQSPVKISFCSFANNKSEDSLNIIRSPFTIKNSRFKTTQSDAIDIDYSDGTIQNTTIINAGNDGIDVSGSNIRLKNIKINGAGDKGISAGEKSIIQAQNISIKHTEIGLASKDHSEINGEKITIKSSKVGFVVFQKKPEFGPSKINIKSSKWKNIQTLYLLEKKSKLKINDRKYSPNTKNVKKILYGVLYGKKSK